MDRKNLPPPFDSCCGEHSCCKNHNLKTNEIKEFEVSKVWGSIKFECKHGKFFLMVKDDGVYLYNQSNFNDLLIITPQAGNVIKFKGGKL